MPLLTEAEPGQPCTLTRPEDPLASPAMRYRWEVALIAVAAVWGSTFVLVQDAVERVPPFLFIALRFGIATLALAAIGAFRGLRRDEAIAGAAIGLALFSGYGFQTVGLQYTTPSNAGFITGLFVVITPLLGAALLRRLPNASASVGALLATTGLVLLAMPTGFSLGRGDALVLVAATSFAVHILVIARLGEGRSALRLAGVQIATATVLAAAWTIGEEGARIPTDGFVWFAVVLTGVLATAAAFFIQTAAQRTIPPTRTAVILSAEPAFAGLFGFLLAGDRLGARGYTGAALIMVGILVAELLAPARERVTETV